MRPASPRRPRVPGRVDRAAFPYRMKDLCAQSGLSRQAVHFYIQQGLLPEGARAGRNMAYYGEAHVERLRLVRRLQEERFLPLKAIRALLEERDDAFTPPQRALIAEVRARVVPPGPAAAEAVPVAAALARTGVTRAELARMVALGMLATRTARGRAVLAREDLALLELWGALRAAGFSAALGFRVDDLLLFQEAVAGLLQREVALLAERLAGLPPGEGAARVERALPLVGAFLAHLHTTQARHFLVAHAAAPGAPARRPRRTP